MGPVRMVRLEIRSLAAERPDISDVQEAPAGLVKAFAGYDEIRADPSSGGWRLYREGVFVGTVTRPVNVRLLEAIAPHALAHSSTPTLDGLADPAEAT
jgi:hypothetical protein